MNKVMISSAISLLLIPTCFAEHIYKGKIELKDELFDHTMDCGLNIEKIEECVKSDRTKGKGESFCNDVLLYAGNKKKLIDASESIAKTTINEGGKYNEEQKKMMIQSQKMTMNLLNELQIKYAHQFLDAGLKPEEIGHIPPINNFKCKKSVISEKVQVNP